MNKKLTELFVQVPYSLVEEGFGGSAIVVYMALTRFNFKYTTETKPYFVCSVNDLQKETGLGRRNIIEQLHKLREAEYIYLVGYSKDYGKTFSDYQGPNLRSVWAITEPHRTGAKKEPVKEETGAEIDTLKEKGCKKGTDTGAEKEPICPETGAKKDTILNNDRLNKGNTIIDVACLSPTAEESATAQSSLSEKDMEVIVSWFSENGYSDAGYWARNEGIEYYITHNHTMPTDRDPFILI